MTRTRVVISLSRTRLVATRIGHGRTAASFSVGIDPERHEHAWEEGLRPLDKPLARALKAIEGEGADVSVLISSPQTISHVVSLPISGRRAMAAAKLALADNASFPLSQNPWGIIPLGADHSGSPPQNHFLAMAEGVDCARTIEEWVERAGCRVAHIAPAEGCLYKAVVGRLLSRSVAGVETALHFGEQASVFAAAGDGRLHFVRRIDLGIDLLIDALKRPLHPRSDPEKTIELSEEEARRILFEIGVPGPKDVVDESRGLVGADLLPVMQPALQRCVVEIKQSLRFGLDEHQRSVATLKIDGPGALIPGLRGVLGAETDLDTDERTAPISERPTHLEAHSDLVSLSLGDGRIDSNLLSPSTSMRRAMRRIEKGLWWGSAAAAILIAAEAALLWGSLERTTQYISAIQPAAQQAREASDIEDRARKATARLAATSARIRTSLGHRINWDAWLGEISRLTPASIRLTDMATVINREGATAELRGYAIGEASGRIRESLTEYIETLRACPLVKSVDLGGTQRAALDKQEAQQFEITVQLVSVPTLLPWEARQ